MARPEDQDWRRSAETSPFPWATEPPDAPRPAPTFRKRPHRETHDEPGDVASLVARLSEELTETNAVLLHFGQELARIAGLVQASADNQRSVELMIARLPDFLVQGVGDGTFTAISDDVLHKTEALFNDLVSVVSEELNERYRETMTEQTEVHAELARFAEGIDRVANAIQRSLGEHTEAVHNLIALHESLASSIHDVKTELAELKAKAAPTDPAPKPRAAAARRGRGEQQRTAAAGDA